MNLRQISEFQELHNLQLLAFQIVEGFITGLHQSPYHGFSVEFAEHRIYNTGESTRFIDWKLFGKTDRLYTKKFEEETNLRCQIVIDTSSSMLFPDKDKFNKLAFSIYSAASLINLLSRQRDAVGITLFDEQIQVSTDAKLNNVHLNFLYSRLQETLYNTKQYNKRTDVCKNLHHIAEMIHKRSLVVIFSDMFDNSNIDDIFNALQHLKHNKHEVIIFHVYDSKYEFNFNFENRPYKFIDLENGSEIKLNPNEIRDFVENKTKSFFNEIKMRAINYKIDFVQADINEPFKEVLIKFLLKRQKLN